MADVVVITTDDLEPAVRLRGAFEQAGMRVELLAAGESVADALGEPILLVITGGLRERRARQMVAQARERGRVPIIGLTEPTEPSGREVCRQLGISECFGKPIDPEEVALVGRRLVQREELREITGIVGDTEEMEGVLERIVQIAPVNSTVLILGESGTGKELVARGIHALSPRRHRPFIAVNVAALPETLLESELFGHEKGAFTGASSLRKGFFELANGGTIFLDEIGEMPLSTQTKLLRVLEEREFRRVGGEDLLRVDVRVLAATNRDLREQVQTGQFRRDLYHRLNVLRIDLPALRERRADVTRLIDRFIREFSAEHDRPFMGIDPEAVRVLAEYDWPGNVRELRNLIESMVVLAPGRVIRPEDIPADVRYSRGNRALMPVPMPRQAPATAAGVPVQANGNGGPPPELEFIFRTMFDMRMDLDDLRREFEIYKQRHREPVTLPGVAIGGGAGMPAALGWAPAPPPEPEPPEERGVVVFRPGMTMQDLEREAIGAALREARGNRRRAAEMLGIGERTLYRKLKEYHLEA
ncbi:sigma-54 dependent transcriptional regulator [Longimicrobium sp.]|uniref:sigma-54 interaction domain-containing protein n=1 Tax=Longimicrobium sp. TaxID=2029185 RepID=UPI002BFD5961|nr:sigma-54 dependent transcriptional regulator [Longimicrobium sp.]HSU15663.1 sigma-54 dependent transcriptional regulator [Longimicrobium sp.]